jgi:penicillin-binding protein 2
VADKPEDVKIPLDPANWQIITDAMAGVVNPGGTAPSAHLQGIDFAGKTGSAQTISNVGKARLSGNKAKFKDNGWFVGVEPRRNPEVVVAVLLEEGEHGYLAARTAAQVIKAYVEKQRKQPPNKVAQRNVSTSVEMAGVWSTPDEHHPEGDNLQAGHFRIPLDHVPPALAAAAPGMKKE